MNWTSGICNSGRFKARQAERDEGGSSSVKTKKCDRNTTAGLTKTDKELVKPEALCIKERRGQ